MTWRLAIDHRSGYRYAAPVTSSYNEVRITPLATPSQLVLESNVDVVPSCRSIQYSDYWGTVVHAFDLHQPHTELLVSGRSLVETTARSEPDPDCDWAELRSLATADRFAEFLEETRYAPIGLFAHVFDELSSMSSPRVAAELAMAWVRSSLRYEAGITTVQTTSEEAWQLGAGVCQDFTHLLLSALRALGIPARYASGYLHPNADAEIGEVVMGESHAWVEAWTGNWWGIDPTIGERVGERHVLVARGRDYADVPPLKGVYHGGASESVGVTVQLTRLA
ncbi:MAG: transglutaminase family protein [Acidobacteria bacterium]|nr:transglutaminase family protein [Acidobacteriota bacterium]